MPPITYFLITFGALCAGLVLGIMAAFAAGAPGFVAGVTGTALGFAGMIAAAAIIDTFR